MGFHTHNPEIIYECGGGGFTDEKTDLRISYDGGNTWEEKADLIDQTTSISEELRMKSEESDDVYDLSGREFNSQFIIHNSQLKHGIYILNGKKVAIK